MRIRFVQIFAFVIVFAIGIMLIEHVLSNLYWNSSRIEMSLNQQIKRNKHVIENGPDYDALILGDSTGTNGVIPKQLENLTGIRSYNFATTSTDAPIADIYFLERYLESHPPPKAIVVVRAIHGWSFNTPDDLIREHFESIHIRWLLYGSGHTSFSKVITSIVARVLPSFDRQYNIHRFLFANPNRVTLDMFLSEPTFDSIDQDSGFLRSDAVIDDKGIDAAVKAINVDVVSQVYVPTTQNIVLLKDLCDIAMQHDIHAVFVSSPFIAGVGDNPVFTEAIEKLSVQIQSALENQPNCSWHRPEALPNKAMSDLIHPNFTGANLFTQKVSEYLMSKD